MVNLVYAIIHETLWVIHCGYRLAQLLIGMQIQSLLAEREIKGGEEKKTGRGCNSCRFVDCTQSSCMLKYSLFADFGALALSISCLYFLRRSRQYFYWQGVQHIVCLLRQNLLKRDLKQ